jgi:hypothetical protein
MMPLKFFIGEDPVFVEINDLIIAGWTGRDSLSVEHHIAELEAIGVARPRTTPCFYRCGSNLLTTSQQIDVTGGDSSGEVEFVLVSYPQGLMVGVGSDHTDRKVEAYGVTVSKQMCPKPIGAELWSFSDVQSHWDALILRSFVHRDGQRLLYQEGAVARMLPPADLISRLTGGDMALPVGTAMYCGTMPLLQPIGHSEQFELELEDPVRRKTIKHSYKVRTLLYSD